MKEILITIIKISVLLAIPVSTLVLSLRLKKLNAAEFLEHKATLLKYILTMFIIAPAVAIVYYYIFGDYQIIWIGLLIITLSPPSPGVVNKVGKIGVSQNIGLLFMLTGIVLSLVFIPVTLTISESLLKINLDLGIDDVVLKIAIMFIIPILLGLLISYKFPGLNDILIKILDPISKIAMLVLVICVLIVAVPVIIQKGIVPVLLILLFQLTVLALAHFLAISEKGTGPLISYSVLMRLPAPAIVIAQLNNSLDKHLSTILTFLIVGMLLVTIYGALMNKGKQSTDSAGA